MNKINKKYDQGSVDNTNILSRLSSLSDKIYLYFEQM